MEAGEHAAVVRQRRTYCFSFCFGYIQGGREDLQGGLVRLSNRQWCRIKRLKNPTIEETDGSGDGGMLDQVKRKRLDGTKGESVAKQTQEEPRQSTVIKVVKGSLALRRRHALKKKIYFLRSLKVRRRFTSIDATERQEGANVKRSASHHISTWYGMAKG